MKSLYIVSVQGFKANNPSKEYVELLIKTFRKLYARPDDEIHVVDFPTAYGALIKMAFSNANINELIVAPLNLAEPNAVEKLRAQSQSQSLAMVADIIPPESDSEFYKINPDLFYVNFNQIDRNQQLDWGSPFNATIDSNLYLNYPTLDNNIYYKWNNTKVDRPTALDSGWILFNQLMGMNLLIGQRDPSIAVKTVDYWAGLPANVAFIDSSALSEQLNSVQQEYFSVTREVVINEWTQELFNSNNTIPSSQLINSNAFVENCYMLSDFKFSGLQQLYKSNRDSDTRLIFIHRSLDDKALIEHILAEWTGTNEVTDNSDIQSELDEFYQTFVSGQFEEFWTYCKSRYTAHYVWTEVDFLDDLQSQCHVNNIFWVGTDGNHPSLLKATKLRLAATEFHYTMNNDDVRIIKVGDQCYSKNLYKKFKMTFRNTQTQDLQSVVWNLNQNLLTQKWARCNQFDYLEQECLAEKNYMLQHWEYDNNNPNARNIPALCAELNRYVEIINNYFDGSSDRRVHYHITQYFDPATLDQNILNEIHHHFEVLIGQVWNISDYFKKADLPTSFAIRQLNNLCHELESLRRPGVSSGHQWWTAYIYFPFLLMSGTTFLPAKTYKFVESDYDHFIRTKNYGDLLLHYAQLGKTPLEAWNGRDEVIFDDNITGLRYLSGEFVVSFSPDVPVESQIANHTKEDQQFFPWLESRGQDPRSKFTGVGVVRIGEFDRTLFPGKAANEIMLELYKYDDIYKLELLGENDTVLVEKIMDYNWRYVLSKTDPTRM
jgi:hypothetical protein